MSKPPSLVSASRGGLGHAALRFMLMLLLACIALQAALVPAQRSAGQAHFHVHGDADHAELHAAAAEAHDDLHRPPASAASHHHAHVDHHDHDDAPDVIHVLEDTAEAGSTPLLKRVAGDADSLLPGRPVCVPPSLVRQARAAQRSTWCSHVVSPLERPPRRTA